MSLFLLLNSLSRQIDLDNLVALFTARERCYQCNDSYMRRCKDSTHSAKSGVKYLSKSKKKYK